MRLNEKWQPNPDIDQKDLNQKNNSPKNSNSPNDINTTPPSKEEKSIIPEKISTAGKNINNLLKAPEILAHCITEKEFEEKLKNLSLESLKKFNQKGTFFLNCIKRTAIMISGETEKFINEELTSDSADNFLFFFKEFFTALVKSCIHWENQNSQLISKINSLNTVLVLNTAETPRDKNSFLVNCLSVAPNDNFSIYKKYSLLQENYLLIFNLLTVKERLSNLTSPICGNIELLKFQLEDGCTDNNVLSQYKLTVKKNSDQLKNYLNILD